MPLPKEPISRGETPPIHDEAPSQSLLPTAIPTLLLACAPGPELEAVCAKVMRSGVRPMYVASLDLAPDPANAPSHCFVDLGLPGATNYLASLAKSAPLVLPVAILTRNDDPADAYRQGAQTTITRPLDPDLVAAILEGQRSRIKHREKADVAVEHDLRISTANAFEGLLRCVGLEVRTPLATALANVEYLAELGASTPPPSPLGEHEAVIDDTLASLQQLRSVLESISALLPREVPTLHRIRLWDVAQRVLDQLPVAPHQVSLVGDPDVHGLGDETTLLEVTTTLVRRALGHVSPDAGKSVTLHVYAHDTEARITVHDPQPGASEPPLGDPFAPGFTLGKPGQSGLLLTAARHAIVRMGGALSYVSRKRAGSAFRVRLRLAPPASS